MCRESFMLYFSQKESSMQKQFKEDYPKFKAKIDGFVTDTQFDMRVETYVNLFDQMASISPDDIRELLKEVPMFDETRNRSMQLMEQIVQIHLDLQKLFALDEEALGIKYNYDLKKVDLEVAQKLQESAQLLQEYEKVSEYGRELIEASRNPFFDQM